MAEYPKCGKCGMWICSKCEGHIIRSYQEMVEVSETHKGGEFPCKCKEATDG